MNLHRVRLPLAHPFTISRGTRTEQQGIYVELEHDGMTGWGEVTANDFYGHSCPSILTSLEKARPHLERYVRNSPEELWDEMLGLMDGDLFAMSALDIAAHDLEGKRRAQPTWRNWGLQWDEVPYSSFTIGIDSIDVMIRKLDEQPDWPVYKIKLGTDNDLEIVQQLRKQTDATFRVDANCKWSLQQSLEYSKAFAELGVELIEQPLSPSAKVEHKKTLFEQSGIPIIADEDCKSMDDVDSCVGVYHGINIKITKCGGLTPARIMLKHARDLGLQTMLGCMVESSVGISGAAQLAPLLDYADLDGANLLKDQPVSGFDINNGLIPKPHTPGNGSLIDREKLPSFIALD